MAWLARKLGTPLMPWQEQVALVGLEMIPADDQTVMMYAARGVDVTGMMVPAYREVIVTVMRQSGKTTLVLPVQVERMWTPRSTVAYTAQTGLDARQKFTEDQRPILEHSPINAKVKQYYKAADNTGMWWHNGSRLKVLNTGQSPGHGKTIDLAVLDETWADTDDSREQALRPAMVTKPQAQFWNVSTAGTPASAYLLRKVELGRVAAKGDKREGVAYFEWSIPENEDVYSPAVWAKYMPAYGITQSERILRLEAESMREGEFRRAYANQWTETQERLIPGEWWRAVCSPTVRADPVVWVVDARPDRSEAAVFRADGSGNVELVAVRPNVEWVAGEFRERVKEYETIVVDGYGPAAGIADDLEKAGYRVAREDSLGVRKACARFYDAVADQDRIQVRADERLDTAVANAARKSSADSWGWNRDAPGGHLLVGLSLAFAGAEKYADTEVQVMLV